ncbi:MAG: tyrosine-type recombinase/integrase [Gammaproteobacteria bacterium]|nr:tyrosine-type recombinase/integrase [Gammaproteobacteria bacterium]
MATHNHIYPHKRYYWYSDSPVADWLGDFSNWLTESGYCEAVIRRHVAALRFSLEPLAPVPRERCFSQADLQEVIVCPERPREFRHTRSAFEHFLCSCDQWIDASRIEHHADLLDAFRQHLVEMRGLAPSTVDQHTRVARLFLHQALPPNGQLTGLSAVDIERFIAARAKRLGRGNLQMTAAYLRSFLRFCVDRGEVAAGIDIFDMPRRYRDEQLPRAIPWTLIEQLLDSIDRSTPVGLRDHAIFYLMAHYGLRTGEIPLLMLDSVDWKARTLRVEQTKTRSVIMLPLTDPAAEVLQFYLREGRPVSNRPELFPRLIAPAGALTRGAIAEAFRRHVRRSGLPLDSASPYGLRHGFAMRLLERNVGVKAIGDLLGHRSLEATSVYLRLQIDALRDVALPIPGECHAHR